jgi:hypothetical protein
MKKLITAIIRVVTDAEYKARIEYINQRIADIRAECSKYQTQEDEVSRLNAQKSCSWFPRRGSFADYAAEFQEMVG